MNQNSYSKDIAKAIKSCLSKGKLKFQFDNKKGVFSFGLYIKGKIGKINYYIDIKEDEYLVYAVPLMNADIEDKERLSVLTEFICRANYGLKYGNFELDIRDGEIRYKTYVDCEDGIPSESVIKNSIFVPTSILAYYSVGIVDIVYGTSSAVDAIEKCAKKDISLNDNGENEENEQDEDDAETMQARISSRLGLDESNSHTDDSSEDDSSGDDNDATIQFRKKR